MNGVLPYLLAITMVLVVGVLFAGIFSFAFGSRTDRHLGTKLMSARVILQGLAIALFAVIMLLSKH